MKFTPITRAEAELVENAAEQLVRQVFRGATVKFPDTTKPVPAKKTNGAVNGDFAIPLSYVDTGAYQEPLIIMTYGDPGGGKSTLIGSAPGDIGVLPMERKSRQSILAAAERHGKRVIMPEIDLVRTSRAMLITTMPVQCVTPESFAGKGYKPEDMVKKAEIEMGKKALAIPLDGQCPGCCQRCYYRWHANRSKSVAFRMSQMDEVKTIAIDTFGQLIDDMLFACYGRNEQIMPLDRKTFNREVCEFINEISHKNLIFTHHSATIWKDNKPTGKTKPMSSFAKIGHYTSLVIRQWRDDDGDGVETVRYGVTIDDCQANASLIGMRSGGPEGSALPLSDENITFAQLAQLVYPQSDPSVWT